jgi:hypothetical protein
LKYNFFVTPPQATNDPASSPNDPAAAPQAPRRTRDAATGGGGIDANSALWAAMQRDAVRDRRTNPDGPRGKPDARVDA